MRKEAETLLKVIGTDEEIARDGLTSFIALIAAIKKGKDVYGCLKGISIDKKAYKQAVIELAPFFNQMSDDAFKRLMFFSERLDFVDKELGEAIKREYALPAWCKEQLGKRAMFLQTFSEVKPPLFSYRELEKEKEVRESYPWHWIDAMEQVYRERAQREIIKQLCKTKDFKPLYARIPYYACRMPNSERYLEDIISSIRGKVPETEIEKIKHTHLSRIPSHAQATLA